MQNANANVEAVEIARHYKANPEEEIKTAIGIGVAKSYDNPAIAAARKVRRGVYVTVGDAAPAYYESTYKAFTGLKIPASVGQIIAFRGRLRKPENAAGLPFKVGEVTYFFSDTERIPAKPKAETVAPEAAPEAAPEPEAAPKKGRRSAKK